MSEQLQNAREFRKALGTFATGVTIATTTDGEGKPIGVTASSFNSVSLDPPLVLWSLAKSALSRDAFCNSGHFAIHVLAASQEELSNRFARSGEDKFARMDWQAGTLGSPLLADYAALFECRTRHQYDGGDHIIMVGEVIAYESHDHAPLLFHGGSYAERRMRPDNGPDEADEAPDAATLAALVERGLLVQSGTGYDLTARGREQLLDTHALVKAAGSNLADGEVIQALQILRQVIGPAGNSEPHRTSQR